MNMDMNMTMKELRTNPWNGEDLTMTVRKQELCPLGRPDEMWEL